MPKRGDAAKLIRKLIVAPEGQEISELDHKTLELRTIAHVANDRTYIKAFENGEDPHLIQGLKMVKKPIEALSKKEIKECRQSAKCFHPETEVLTEIGWVKMKNLKQDIEIYQAEPINKQGIKLSLVTPTLLEHRQNHCDNLCHLQNEGIDLKVTPDHRMLIQRANEKYEVVSPENFNKCRYFPNVGIKEGGIEVNERLLRLAVMVQADGHFTNSSIRLGFTKERKIKRIEKLLYINEYTTNIHGKVYPYQAYYLKQRISKQIKALLGEDKTFKWEYLTFSEKYRKIIIEEVKYWDAHKASNWKHYQYSSTIEKNVDILQALCSITNIKTRKTSHKDKRNPEYNKVYVLSVKSKSRSRGENVKKEDFTYKNNVCVLSVPSSFILVRDKGVPVITGQSVNFGLPYKMSWAGLQNYAKVYDVIMSDTQAKREHSNFFRTHPDIVQFHTRIERELKQYGYVRSFLGRKRILPEIKSKDKSEKAKALRVGVNFVIQGPSSDLTQMGGHKFIMSDYYKENDDVKVKIFLHDAIYITAPDEKIMEAIQVCKECMEEVNFSPFGVKFKVKLIVDINKGKRLSETEEIKNL